MNILGPENEGRDALMTAALGRSGEALDAWRRWCTSGTDPLTDPLALRWLPLIGWNFNDAAVDDASRDLFRESWRRTWATNTRLLQAAAPAIEALSTAGVRVILLKGASLSLTVYESPWLRPTGDIDVLVEPEHASAALDVLADLGWQSTRHVNAGDLMFCHGINFECPPDGALDLHWHLLAECCEPGVDRGLWQRARPLASGQFQHGPLPVLVLSPADQLLHVCLHGLRWSPVQAGHWVADALRVIDRAGQHLDWNALVDEACRRRLALQMSRALRVLHGFGRAPVPAFVFQTLDAQPVSWRDRAECHVKTRPIASLGGMFFIWCSWVRLARALTERPPGRLRYLAATVGVPSRGRLVSWAIGHAKRRAAAFRRGVVAGGLRRFERQRPRGRPIERC